MASACVRLASARARACVDAGERARIARCAAGTTSRSRRKPPRSSGGASTQESVEYVQTPAGRGEVVPMAASGRFTRGWSNEAAP